MFRTIDRAPRRHQLGRLVAGVGVILVALTLSFSTPEDASAVASSSFAQITCREGIVYASAPNNDFVYSSHPDSKVYIRSELYWYNFKTNRWIHEQSSGWWAYGISWTTRKAGGYPLVGAGFFPSYSWVLTNPERISPYQTPWFTFQVEPGYYYQVRTYLYDAADGTTVWQTNYTGTAGNPYCNA